LDNVDEAKFFLSTYSNYFQFKKSVQSVQTVQTHGAQSQFVDRLVFGLSSLSLVWTERARRLGFWRALLREKAIRASAECDKPLTAPDPLYAIATNVPPGLVQQ
jgi:hypothetical protein